MENYYEMERVLQVRYKCIGCAYCVEIAPEFWSMNSEDGRCDLIGGENKNGIYVLDIFEDEVLKNKKAAEICPSRCIRVES